MSYVASSQELRPPPLSRAARCAVSEMEMRPKVRERGRCGCIGGVKVDAIDTLGARLERLTSHLGAVP
jgi:hypothetical protein